MQKKLINFIKQFKVQLLIAGVSLTCFLIFAYAGRHYFTYDTAVLQVAWWNYIVEHGWSGIATLNNTDVGDYTTIWYFVIALFVNLHLYPTFPIEYSIKFMAVVFSLLSAVAVYFLAKHFRPKATLLPVIAASITPFLPLFSMDLLKTNLTDGVYLALCLWSFYFFIKNRKGLSWFLLALGACFKLMAIYLVPVYLFFYIKDFKSYNLKEKLAPLWGGLAVIICSIPNMLAGGKFLDGIITPILGRGDNGLTMPWFWMIPTGNNFTPPETGEQMRLMVYALLILALFGTLFFIFNYVKKQYQTKVGLAILPTISIMVCFFLLPSQHETYFAMAAIFSLLSFIVLPTKHFFVNFLAINIFLFYMYLYGITWWLEGPTWILPNTQMGVIFLGLIIYNYYLLYRHSVFFKSSRFKEAKLTD